jgi:hypothetical protein
MIWREPRDDELISCLGVDSARMGAEIVGHDRAKAAWKQLAASRSFHSALVETGMPIGGHRIVAFGASVFVSRLFADEEVVNPRPGLNARIIGSIVSGHPVVLNQAELRAANTEGGLDLVVLCGHWRKGILGAKEISEVQMLLASAFLDAHRGFRFNRLLTENLDEVERRSYAEASGTWRIISDFRDFHLKYPGTPWSRDRSLAVITAEEAFKVPGHITQMLFQYHEPVLRLQDANQQLLTSALTGLTDEELARSLKLPLSAIKKRWRSLFEKASAHPSLFPDMCDGLGDAGRGRQKRQFILTYVREHPEELRPFKHTR